MKKILFACGLILAVSSCAKKEEVPATAKKPVTYMYRIDQYDLDGKSTSTAVF